MRLSHPAAAVLALCAGCAPPGPLPDAPGACTLPAHGTLALAPADADLGVAAGEARLLARPVVLYGPEGSRPVAEGCPVAWGVEGGGAEIDAHGRLTVGPGARPGDSLLVVARALGGSARGSVRVVAPGPHPLAGRWRQEPTPECVGPQGPVGELEFRRTGDVLITFRPFESHVDLVGTYTFDGATGRVVMRSPERRVAEGVFLEGRARLAGDSLTLELSREGDPVGLFDARMSEHGCRAVFRSFGAPRQPRATHLPTGAIR